MPYEYVHNPTGHDYQEVIDWLAKVETYLGKPIIRIGQDLTEIIYKQGILPSAKSRFCTRLAKIEPIEAYLKGEPATCYYGIRADENRTGYVPSMGGNILPKYPLVEAGLGLADVWLMLEKLDLLPPMFFWPKLYERVQQRLGMFADQLDNLHPFEKGLLFSGRKRSNCFDCFNQSMYEWAWLLDTKPDKFAQAEKEETEVGINDIRTGLPKDKPFYLSRKQKPLQYVRDNFDKILDNRSKVVYNLIVKRMQLKLTPLDTERENDIDFLVGTSCGVLCGK